VESGEYMVGDTLVLIRLRAYRFLPIAGYRHPAPEPSKK
jgi:hypothetical protein